MKNTFIPPVRPAHVPPPPEPWIYVGTAPFPHGDTHYVMSAWSSAEPTWDMDNCYFGSFDALHYAVLPGSPAALALGIEDTREPAEPEPEAGFNLKPILKLIRQRWPEKYDEMDDEELSEVVQMALGRSQSPEVSLPEPVEPEPVEPEPVDGGGPAFRDASLRDVAALVAMHALISRGHDAYRVGSLAFEAAESMLTARKGGTEP